MVPFAGYSLPVQFPDGVLKSHLHTRAAGCASLFDVGHMGQLKWFGKDRAAFLERVCIADVHGLAPGASTLTLLTLPHGGILDDSILSNHSAWGYQCVAAFLCGRARDVAVCPTSRCSLPPRPRTALPPPSPAPQLHGGQRRDKGKGHGAL